MYGLVYTFTVLLIVWLFVMGLAWVLNRHERNGGSDDRRKRVMYEYDKTSGRLRFTVPEESDD